MILPAMPLTISELLLLPPVLLLQLPVLLPQQSIFAAIVETVAKHVDHQLRVRPGAGSVSMS